ncbi:polysaccharide pyruvyl transferase family protein [Fulvivirga sp. 29W222]|uniref:Polysaccharide pyruvyl transferase family protein n=1 Tax=Fulvivirga marina TaxID=2494733 RepID=A0A937FXK8_9BACT|nr:polysaccharide pyruvyl transferase family protein [Fulvivirga marina]MBL6446872.1 polysaccharide pyruvyl transferase family protein [Fulvivirga marina]
MKSNQNRASILIRGYYGFGNFGDDILLLTTFNVIRDALPNAEVQVFSNAPIPGYICKLLGTDIGIIDYKANKHFDFLIDGGGGVYFDFATGTTLSAVRNKVIDIIGHSTFSSVLNFYKRFKGTPGVTATYQLGVGIGVGTFTKSSNRYPDSVRKLSAYNILMVRDPDSLCNLKKIKFGGEVGVFSDLAFLTDYWLPKELKKNQKKRGKSIGFVVRVWNQPEYFDWCLSRAELLASRGYEVSFFCFEKNSDAEIVERLSTKPYQLHVWSPHEGSLQVYLSHIADLDLIISMRAHGTIVGACLGVPSINLDIEPKLKIVSEMFPRSSVLLNIGVTEPKFIESIEEMLQRRVYLESEVQKNRAIMIKGKEKLCQFLLSKNRNR